MCGIIGYVGKENNAIEVLINGLSSLLYRGYDSAGIAVFSNQKLVTYKEVGALDNLKNILNYDIKANIGIGHTRWATHGQVNKINAHPHTVGKITVVHNGIIENYQQLKAELLKKQVVFKTDTDTEVIAALLNELYKKYNIIEALELLKKKLKGSYALGILLDDNKDTLYAVKNKSPLVVGVSSNQNFIASDVIAMLKYTTKYIDLDDGDIAVITKDRTTFYNKNREVITKSIKTFKEIKEEDMSKGLYEHFMLKEIFEQPLAIQKTLDFYLNNNIINLDKTLPDFSKYNKIIIVGCGSAMHAGMIGKYLLENYANIKTEVEIASCFRYEKLFLDKKTLVIVISQSGETADTLAAVKLCNDMKIDTFGIVNRKDSSIARCTRYVLYTEAGLEQAVATTKAYLTQVLVLSLIAFKIGYKKQLISDKLMKDILLEYQKLPKNIESLLSNQDSYKEIAKLIYKKEHLFFIGRGIDYAIAMEGSLKLKEVSYIHSEAYPAGELKHGTIALIDKDCYVISIVSDELIKDKTISNIKEVKARMAKIIYVTSLAIDNTDGDDYKIMVPKTSNLLQPILMVVPLQLLAYEVAKLKKCDIDKPRNLAKSVTVE